MEPTRASRVDGWIAVSLGGIALVAYLATLAIGAYPGPFSSALVQGMGLFPRLAPDHPLWFLLARGVGHLPNGGDPAVPLHALSGVCGAIAVAFLYRVMQSTTLLLVRHDDAETTAAAQTAARLAGVGAALALAFCLPFWIASTRCHWASFHVLLFLVTAYLFNVAVARYSRRAEWAWAFLFGLGMVEYPTFIIFLPLYASLYVYVLHRRESTEFKTWGPTLAWFVVGLCGYFLAAWQFLGSEGAVLRGHQGFLEVLWSLWRDQWFLLARSLPSQGWLVVLVVTALPAATALLVARRGLNDENDWTYIVLHIVLSGLCVAVLLNLRIAPWAMLGFQRLLVMPYVLLAAVFGYMMAFWWRLPSGWWRRSAGPLRQALRKGFGPVVAALGLSLAVVAAVRNAGPSNGRASAFIRAYAIEVIRGLDGRTWLVTDGVLDAALLVESYRLGTPIKILDLSAEKSALMQAHVAAQFTDSRMRNLAQLSFRSLVRHWLEKDPNAAKDVAMLVGSDIWLGAGYKSLPQVGLFLGVRELQPADADAIMRRHREAWDRLDDSPYLAGTAPVGGLDRYRQYIRRQLSMVANNVGVLMEDLDRDGLAYEAYSRARVQDAGNISALMNLYSMVAQGYAAPDAAAVRTALLELKQTLSQHKPNMAALSEHYGVVRSPTAFATLGKDWALAGRPELAVSGLRRAMGLMADEDQGGIKETLAGLYLLQNRDQDSEILFYELLVENPRHHAALLGMARVEMGRRNWDKARGYLERAVEAEVPASLMNLEWAAFHMASGEPEKAQAQLATAVAQNPDLLRAWAMIAAIQIQQRDPVGLYETIRSIQRVKQGNALLLAITSGYLSIMQDDLAGAAVAFEKALAMQPQDPHLLEWIVRLDILQGQSSRVNERLRQLLQLDPANAFGNFVMAGLQMGRKEFDLARDSLRQSLSTQRTPEALNDLAWLLQESGLYAEAEEHVRSALELNPDMHQAWDTLGEILMKTDRDAEAREAFEKALAGSPGSAIITLHLAELDLKQGRRQDASGRLDALGARRAELSTEERTLLMALQQKL